MEQLWRRKLETNMIHTLRCAGNFTLLSEKCPAKRWNKNPIPHDHAGWNRLPAKEVGQRHKLFIILRATTNFRKTITASTVASPYVS